MRHQHITGAQRRQLPGGQRQVSQLQRNMQRKARDPWRGSPLPRRSAKQPQQGRTGHFQMTRDAGRAHPHVEPASNALHRGSDRWFDKTECLAQGLAQGLLEQ
ncbi:hypothetical protein D3C80_1716610 [compost metagenome]